MYVAHSEERDSCLIRVIGQIETFLCNSYCEMSVRSHFVTKAFKANTAGMLNAVPTHTYMQVLNAHIPEQLRVYTIGENNAVLAFH